MTCYLFHTITLTNVDLLLIASFEQNLGDILIKILNFSF